MDADKEINPVMEIVPWGVRGSVPVSSPNVQLYGGNTTCVEIRHAGKAALFFDAGTGIIQAGKVLGPTGEAHIFLTHLHFDHIQGLPFFAPMFNPEWVVHIYLPETEMNAIHNFMNGIYFPIKSTELPCELHLHPLSERYSYKIDDLRIECLEVPHPGICYALRAKTQDMIFCFAPDMEIHDYSDLSALAPFFSNADLAFVNAFFTPEEYALRQGWGHSSYLALPRLAQEAHIKKLVLCHHAPYRTDAELDALLDTLRTQNDLPYQWDIAKEHQSHPLNFASTEGVVHIRSSNFFAWMADFSRELLRYNDLGTILDRILTEARKLSNADAGTIFLVENNELVFSFTHNDTLFPADRAHKYSYAHARLPINKQSLAGYCATMKTPLNIPNVRELSSRLPYQFNDAFDRATNYHTVSVLCIPLLGKDNEIISVIQLINGQRNGEVVPFTHEMINILTFLGVHAVNAIERTLLVREMILRMQRIAAMSDPHETGAHMERVGAVAAEIYQVIAEKNQTDIDQRRLIRDQIRLAAMLHDLGKIAIPCEILKKPGKLTAEETQIMQTHCAVAKKLFFRTSEQMDVLAKDIALHHHQRYDGTGYTGHPDIPVLAGEEIPLPARITAVADVFDALVSIRSYKPAWPWENATSHIRQAAGTHFDPMVVEAFFEVEDTIRAIYHHFQEQ